MDNKSLSYTKEETVKALKALPTEKGFPYSVSAYAILQCKKESGRTFLSLEEIDNNVVLDDYNFIAAYKTNEIQKKMPIFKLLEDIFEIFNIRHPKNFKELKAHSLSVSDIIAIKTNNQISFYFVNTVGFEPLIEETVHINKLER